MDFITLLISFIVSLFITGILYSMVIKPIITDITSIQASITNLSDNMDFDNMKTLKDAIDTKLNIILKIRPDIVSEFFKKYSTTTDTEKELYLNALIIKKTNCNMLWDSPGYTYNYLILAFPESDEEVNDMLFLLDTHALIKKSILSFDEKTNTFKIVNDQAITPFIDMAKFFQINIDFTNPVPLFQMKQLTIKKIRMTYSSDCNKLSFMPPKCYDLKRIAININLLQCPFTMNES